MLTSKLQDLTRRKQEQSTNQEEDDDKKKAQEKLAKLVEEQRNQQQQAEKDETKEKLEQLVGQALNTPKRTDAALGVSDADRLRDHIAGCWNPPSGAAGADSLTVGIIIKTDSDANVQIADVEDKSRWRRDKTFKAAAQAAVRAVVDCSPLPLPKDDSGEGRSFIFVFNPGFITRR